MSTLKLSPEFLREIHELAACWGKAAASRATRELGSDPQLTFSDMETFARAVAAGVVEGTILNLFNAQAQPLATHQPCPACGDDCPIAHQERSLTLETGQTVQLQEPICHCPHCRRDFFPPADVAASGRASLQPQRHPDDR